MNQIVKFNDVFSRNYCIGKVNIYCVFKCSLNISSYFFNIVDGINTK